MRILFSVFALLLSVGVANATDPVPTAKADAHAKGEAHVKSEGHEKAKHKHHQKKHHPMHKSASTPATKS